MKAEKQKRLENAGWRVGDAGDFLELSDDEAQFVDIKLVPVLECRKRARGQVEIRCC